MARVDSVQFDRFSAMGHNMTDFEACYSFTPGGSFRSTYHCHDFYELYILFQGGRTMEIDRSVYDMHPNQFYIIPPFSMHSALSSPDTDYERAFLYIQPDVLKTCGCGQMDLDSLFQSRASVGSYCFSMRAEQAARCKELMLRLRENQETEDPLARFRDYTILLPLLEMMAEAVFDASTPVKAASEQSVMRDILKYVNGNYMKPLRVETIAQTFGVSVSFMAHEFKRYTSRSVYDYILYRRIMLAKKLIPQSASLISVSEQCGFDNYSNFLRLFYKYVGVSPSTYKKIILSD